MLLGNSAKKVLEVPQVLGINVTPLNVEVLGIEPQEQEGNTQTSTILVIYALHNIRNM
jgi:hypothetical protein